MTRRLLTMTAGLAVLGFAAVQGQQVTKESVPGVTNFARVDTTIACAGATTPEAAAGLKKMGYASIINLRLATEAGANIEAAQAAAKSAGIRYIHLPFNGAMPDPLVVDAFIKAVSEPANQPAFVHCASGNRAAALWMAKRLLVDHWDADRADREATGLGLTSSALKTFVLDYAKSHGR
jgi:uncharacterized protein (TIGR01244 family)